MEIIATCDFKHGTGVFVSGESYELEPKDAYYLIGLGWAKEPGQEAIEQKPANATLDIKNSVIGVKDNAKV